MCAIFGLGLLNNHKMKDPKVLTEVITELAKAAQIRGYDSTGLAYTSRRKVTVIKNPVPAAKFVTLPEYQDTAKACLNLDDKDNPLFSIMGHCRAQTKGTKRNNVNNHPIVRDNVVGAHNGMIGNDDGVFGIYSRVIKRNGEVDSEVIFALIEYFSKGSKDVRPAITLAGRSLSGSIACSMVHRAFPHALWLFRRNNPCDVLLYKDAGVIAWASSKDFIKTAVMNKDEFGETTPIDLPANCGISIDLLNNKLIKYDFPSYQQKQYKIGLV